MFSDPTPSVELLPDELVRVDDAFSFTLDREVAGLPVGLRLDIPSGFVSDLASVPRPLWFILPPHGSYAPAAIVHDLLYRAPGHIVDGRAYSRAQADAVLEQAMLSLGTVKDWECLLIYWGVRVLGWLKWSK